VKYIAFTYNIFTLAHILSYTDNSYGRENVSIVYSDIASMLPEVIRNDYKIHFVPSNDILSKRRINAIICACNLSLRIWKVVDKILSSNSEETTLIVFRDNEIEEASFIEKAIKKYGEKVHVWVMEEGNGIYAKEKNPIRYLKIKQILYKLSGVSSYSLQNKTQGLHPSVEKIICSKPYVIREKLSLDIELETKKDVFTRELNEYLIKSVCGQQVKSKHYKYVFLTQPFENFRGEHDELIESYKKLLPLIFKILSERGRVIIKLHPRETLDYSLYLNDQIDICTDEEKILPFQCLMQYYDYPQMISMFSSACAGIDNTYPSIYMYKIFNIHGIERLFSEEYYKTNHIIACSDIEEFKSQLAK